MKILLLKKMNKKIKIFTEDFKTNFIKFTIQGYMKAIILKINLRKMNAFGVECRQQT